ncbi:hypothetical protein C8F00_1945 [Xanthomonas vasicola]
MRRSDDFASARILPSHITPRNIPCTSSNRIKRRQPSSRTRNSPRKPHRRHRSRHLRVRPPQPQRDPKLSGLSQRTRRPSSPAGSSDTEIIEADTASVGTDAAPPQHTMLQPRPPTVDAHSSVFRKATAGLTEGELQLSGTLRNAASKLWSLADLRTMLQIHADDPAFCRWRVTPTRNSTCRTVWPRAASRSRSCAMPAKRHPIWKHACVSNCSATSRPWKTRCSHCSTAQVARRYAITSCHCVISSILPAVQHFAPRYTGRARLYE